ncbi:MAG: ABC transporter permease [Nocardioidaceae bacterium]
MLGYILRRLVAAFLVVVVTSMFVFALFFLGPSNPAAVICNQNGRCTQERQALLETALGLNDSVFHQYGLFVKGLVVDRTISTGPGASYDCPAPCLGISYRTREPVMDQLKQKYPATVSLALVGGTLYLMLGVTIGVFAAKWRGTSGRPAAGGRQPGRQLHPVLPGGAARLALPRQPVQHLPRSPATSRSRTTRLKWASGLLLPWLVLMVALSPQYARFGRGAMVETMSEDYIRTASAKGLPTNRVLFKHGLRAAIVPIVTIFGLDLAASAGRARCSPRRSSSVDGIGKWGIEAIPVDFPVISATVLVAAVLVVLANLIVDILYSFLDPRVRLA